MSIEIMINHTSCDGCGECLSACSGSVLAKKGNKIEVISEDLCKEVRHCLPSCHNQALEVIGETKEVLLKNYCDGSESDSESCDLNFSELFNWPVKLRAVPVSAPYLEDADLLIASDCSAFVHGRFHEEVLQDKVLVTTCPQYLDSSEKEALERILRHNHINSITVVEMGVKCCSTLHTIVEETVALCGKNIAVENIRLTKDGNVIL